MRRTCPEGTELPSEMSIAASEHTVLCRAKGKPGTQTQQHPGAGQSSRGASGPGEGGLDRDVVGKEGMEQERLKFRKFPNLL